MPDCELEECSEEATHKLVYNHVRSGKTTEYYCEVHADYAADAADDDPAGDVFYGPVPIEE